MTLATFIACIIGCSIIIIFGIAAIKETYKLIDDLEEWEASLEKREKSLKDSKIIINDKI